MKSLVVVFLLDTLIKASGNVGGCLLAWLWVQSVARPLPLQGLRRGEYGLYLKIPIHDQTDQLPWELPYDTRFH